MTIAEELNIIKNRLEANLEEMKSVCEAQLAMRELCAYELQKIKQERK